MTKKRFTIGNVLTKCSGLRDNGKLMTFNEVVDLLNAQHEEIKYYKDLLGDYLDIQEENEQLKKNKFICLDCEHSGYAEIGCLCEYNDYWQDYITECEDFKELRE